LDTNKNSIGSAWDTDTITISPADTIDLSSLQYSEDISTVSIGATTISNGGYSIGTGGTGTGGLTGGYTFSSTAPNTVWTTSASPSTIGNINWGPASAAQIEQSGRMSLRGDNADLDINGKSLKNWMERVEERLNILTPNPELEKEWDDLRRLGDRYRKLEKKCQQKAQMWEALKKLPKPKL
jgi:hypothetical protein